MKCTNCGSETDPETVLVKKVSFIQPGLGGRNLRSRNVAKLCPTCVVTDPAWNQKPFVEANK